MLPLDLHWLMVFQWWLGGLIASVFFLWALGDPARVWLLCMLGDFFLLGVGRIGCGTFWMSATSMEGSFLQHVLLPRSVVLLQGSIGSF